MCKDTNKRENAAVNDDSIDVEVCGYYFSRFLGQLAANNGQVLPELTGPLLKGYEIERPCIMQALINAFVAGLDAGCEYCAGLAGMKQQTPAGCKNSNLTKIE